MSEKSAETAGWEAFKAGHPPGTAVTGIVTRVEAFGVFVDLGVPWEAVLLVPYLTPTDRPKAFPEDYPAVGDRISAHIRHYSDDVVAGEVGRIALTQEAP